MTITAQVAPSHFVKNEDRAGTFLNALNTSQEQGPDVEFDKLARALYLKMIKNCTLIFENDPADPENDPEEAYTSEDSLKLFIKDQLYSSWPKASSATEAALKAATRNKAGNIKIKSFVFEFVKQLGGPDFSGPANPKITA